MSNRAKYQDVLDELKEQIDQFEAKNYGMQPIREIYEQLQQRSSDIKKIEDHIDAVRNEIITPVKQELSEGRLIGRVGLVLGVLGFAAAIFGTLYPVYRDDPNQSAYQGINEEIAQTNTDLAGVRSETRKSMGALERMMQTVLSRTGFAPVDASDYEPVEGEHEAPRFKDLVLLDHDGEPIKIRLIEVRRVAPVAEDEETKVMVADFWLYKDDELIGDAGLNDYVRVESVWPRDRIIRGNRDYLSVAENDTIVILDIYRFTLTKVMSNESLGRPQAENRISAFIQRQDD